MDTCGVFLLLLFCVCVAGTDVHWDSGNDLHLELSIGHGQGGCKNGSKEVGEADQHVVHIKTNQHAADCGNLANDLDQLQTSYNILNEQKKQFQTSFDQLQTSHNNLTEHNDNLQSSYNRLQSRFEQLQSRYNNVTEQKNLLHTGFDQLRHSYKNLTGHNDNLQSSFEDLQSSFEQLQSRYDNVTEQNTQIQLALQNSHDNLEEQRELLQNSIDRLQSSHVNLTDGMDQIQSGFERLQFSHDNLTEHTGYLQARYNQIKLSFERLQSRYNNITEQKGQLQSTFDQLQIIRNNLSEEMEQMQSSFDQLQISHHNLSEENDQMQSRLEELIEITDEAKSHRCESPWTLDGGVCYYMFKIRKTWDGSRNECRDRDSDLFIMNTTEKKELVDRVAPWNFPMWIGLSDKKKEGNYMWVDKTPLNETSTFWYRGQPHQYLGIGMEGCVYYYNGVPGSGWIYRPCAGKWYFMCEIMM